MEVFSGYGFNKAHSSGYAFVAYQAAYLKAHYPAEYMAANLNSEIGDIERLVVLIDECRRIGTGGAAAGREREHRGLYGLEGTHPNGDGGGAQRGEGRGGGGCGRAGGRWSVFVSV